MQYYVKVFNSTTHQLVGYYKETGKNCLSKMLNGIKYFNTVEEALAIAGELDGGFIRDADKHYYTGVAVVYGNSERQPPKEAVKSQNQKEEEMENELNAFIRKNSNPYRE